MSAFLDCDKTEYKRILDVLGPGIYICATVHSREMMRSGITRKLV